MSAVAVGVLEEELENLLELSQTAEDYERVAFDSAANPRGQRLVIYGAGGIGRRIAAGLRGHGLEPLAFADRNPRLWGGEVEGLKVLPPAQAARRFGAEAVFVVAAWNPALTGGANAIGRELRVLGCSHVVPFSWLFWKYPQTFLPYYLWDLPSRMADQTEPIRAAFESMADARSRSEFVRQLEFRLTANFDCLSAMETTPQYFPPGSRLAPGGECFVDCGAYDGDTLKALADWTGGAFHRAIAFESDPANFSALQATVENDDRLRGHVRAVAAAVGRTRGKVRFQASGLSSAAISDSGDYEVDSVPLDEALDGERSTFIKMDIEGAEADALLGAASVVRRDCPRLAICCYHQQDHLWRIPNLMAEMLPGSRLLLRPYAADGWELVCYAVPPQYDAGFLEEFEP